jgi:hypothetical protein
VVVVNTPVPEARLETLTLSQQRRQTEVASLPQQRRQMEAASVNQRRQQTEVAAVVLVEEPVLAPAASSGCVLAPEHPRAYWPYTPFSSAVL